jgi:hypothetical protein
MLQAGRSRVRDPMRLIIFFSFYLILPASLGPGHYSASNGVPEAKKNNVSGEQNAVGA